MPLKMNEVECDQCFEWNFVVVPSGFMVMVGGYDGLKMNNYDMV